MRHDEIDLHIVAMVLLTAPALFLSWWLPAVPLLTAQGRISVRAFGDYSAFGRQPWAYLVANELSVVGSIGLLAGSRTACIAISCGCQA